MYAVTCRGLCKLETEQIIRRSSDNTLFTHHVACTKRQCLVLEVRFYFSQGETLLSLIIEQHSITQSSFQTKPLSIKTEPLKHYQQQHFQNHSFPSTFPAQEQYKHFQLKQNHSQTVGQSEGDGSANTT